MKSLPWLFLLAFLVLPAQPQLSRLAVATELGGVGVAATLNLEYRLFSSVHARVGLGTMPAWGVRLAVPATVRYSLGTTQRMQAEVGAGLLVASLYTEYLHSSVTGVWHTPSPQVFPAVEIAVRLWRRGFARLGAAVLFDRYNSDRARARKTVPTLGLGWGR